MSNQYIGNSLLELVKHIGKSQAGRSQVSCEGTITSVDPQTYMAKVMLQPYGVETGWLPIASIAAGNGWGFFHLPPDNSEVTVDFIGGDANNGRVRGIYSNETDAPPAGLAQGEVMLQHSSGTMLHFDASGNLNIVTAKDLSIISQGDTLLSALGNCTAVVQGDATVSTQGNVNVIANKNATIAAVGAVNLAAQGNVGIAANGAITLAATGALNLTGASINLTGPVTAAAGLALTVTGAFNITAGSMGVTAPTTIDGVTSIGPSTTIDGRGFLGHQHTEVVHGTDTSGYVL